MSQEKFNAMMAISIHAPTRGATFIGFDCCFDILISIHAPTRGATLTACTKEGFARFQSTLPRGERPDQLHRYREPQDFNPRSHEGSDICSLQINNTMTDFNPRSHEGSDRASPNTNIHSWHFNPRSHEGSDVAVADRMRAVDISIHAPTRGATMPVVNLRRFRRFQSTLPRGERHFWNFPQKPFRDFNPRSHEGSDP